MNSYIDDGKNIQNRTFDRQFSWHVCQIGCLSSSLNKAHLVIIWKPMLTVCCLLSCKLESNLRSSFTDSFLPFGYCLNQNMLIQALYGFFQLQVETHWPHIKELLPNPSRERAFQRLSGIGFHLLHRIEYNLYECQVYHGPYSMYFGCVLHAYL